jgi:hypothetical protein
MNNAAIGGFSIVQVGKVWELRNPYGYVLYRGSEKMCEKVLESYRKH